MHDIPALAMLKGLSITSSGCDFNALGTATCVQAAKGSGEAFSVPNLNPPADGDSHIGDGVTVILAARPVANTSSVPLCTWWQISPRTGLCLDNDVTTLETIGPARIVERERSIAKSAGCSMAF